MMVLHVVLVLAAGVPALGTRVAGRVVVAAARRVVTVEHIGRIASAASVTGFVR